MVEGCFIVRGAEKSKTIKLAAFIANIMY